MTKSTCPQQTAVQPFIHAATRPSSGFSLRAPRLGLGLLTVFLSTMTVQSWAHPPASDSKQRPHAAKAVRERAAADGHVGYASFYANRFSGRTMADGTPMRPDSDNAASLTLPLGSKALVTNLRNGRIAIVTIRDRGPYIKGRIIDVSPSTARSLGMVNAGVVKVAVLALDDLPPEDKIEAIVAAADAGDTVRDLAP